MNESPLCRKKCDARVVRGFRHFTHKLRFEGESKRRSARVRTQAVDEPVVETLAATESCAAQIKRAQWNDERIKVARVHATHQCGNFG